MCVFCSMIHTISIHALLAESDKRFLQKLAEAIISIHALLAESDSQQRIEQSRGNISIHALLAESDMLAARWAMLTLIFLSTLSLRRATLIGQMAIHSIHISIHALLAESDR